MKIATWNVERLKHYAEIEKIQLACESTHADILVLTETDTRLKPNYRYCFHTQLLGNHQAVFYGETENRVSIFTNYPCMRHFSTADEMTSLCVKLETELGSLCVYGTIIGIYGNRRSDFLPSLRKQMEDIQHLYSAGEHICICGDFNCSFSDNFYFTKAGRTVLKDSLAQCNLSLLTQERTECIDHIAISQNYIGNRSYQVDEWNIDKELSDHKGIAVTLI